MRILNLFFIFFLILLSLNSNSVVDGDVRGGPGVLSSFLMLALLFYLFFEKNINFKNDTKKNKQPINLTKKEGTYKIKTKKNEQFVNLPKKEETQEEILKSENSKIDFIIQSLENKKDRYRMNYSFSKYSSDFYTPVLNEIRDELRTTEENYLKRSEVRNNIWYLWQRQIDEITKDIIVCDYKGELKENSEGFHVKDGIGIQFYVNNGVNLYIGEYKNGKRHGVGIYIINSGPIEGFKAWEGEWKEGEFVKNYHS